MAGTSGGAVMIKKSDLYSQAEKLSASLGKYVGYFSKDSTAAVLDIAQTIKTLIEAANLLSEKDEFVYTFGQEQQDAET